LLPEERPFGLSADDARPRGRCRSGGDADGLPDEARRDVHASLLEPQDHIRAAQRA
jgi:hypothetical protein